MSIEIINCQKELVLYSGFNGIDGNYAVICPREHLNDLKSKLYNIYKTYFYGPCKKILWSKIQDTIVLPKYIRSTNTFKIDGTLHYSIGYFQNDNNYVTAVKLVTEAGTLAVCDKEALKKIIQPYK